MRRSEAEAEFMAGFDIAAKQDADEFKRLDARIEELEAALRPFSVFHAALVKLGGASPKNGDFYTIQAGGEAAVTLRIEDFDAARAVLGS